MARTTYVIHEALTSCRTASSGGSPSVPNTMAPTQYVQRPIVPANRDVTRLRTGLSIRSAACSLS
jgi:hypothetical protein